MKTYKNYSMFIVMLMAIGFASCSDKSPTPGGDGNDDGKGDVEGSYAGTWVSDNSQLPESWQDEYSGMEFVVSDDDTYKWTYIKKDGQTAVFSGIIYHGKSEFKHSSGSAIWSLSIVVNELNGQQVTGGWDGIYTYENSTTLKMNVEPAVDAWTKWPTTEGGLGSGDKGFNTVYTFSKK
jgi:hypothetical protein